MATKISNGRKRRSLNHFTARQKCEAVLSVWLENRRPSDVCRDLEINWATLSQWQNRAMEAMLLSLAPAPATRKSESDPITLRPKLQMLLEKKSVQMDARQTQISRKVKTIHAAEASREGASRPTRADNSRS
jgi:hypothetical protein